MSLRVFSFGVISNGPDPLYDGRSETANLQIEPFGVSSLPPRVYDLQMEDKLGIADRVVLITGAGGPNMGRAAGRLFASHGAKVFVTDIRRDALEDTASLIRSSGGEVAAEPADILNEAAVQAMVARAQGVYGAIHHVLNFAATYDPRVGTLECTSADWDRILGVVLRGTWLVSKYAMMRMRDNPPIGEKGWRGSIVTVGSVLAHRGGKASLAYTAAKAGVLGLNRAMAQDGAAFGIRVNCISPGLTRTPATPLEKGSDKEKAVVAQCHVLPYMSEPEDMAEAALWLCSDAARSLTGAVLNIDCGWTTKI
jgi:NAD(P)-dependent dehydrogenase (short-subunit alcohol dehydrogenase family)